MALKSLKSKSIRKQPKHNLNTISYDRYSFILGEMKILTDYLSKQTKDLLLKLYKKKHLNILVQKIRHHNPYNERFIVLTENEALEMIKHLALRKKRQLLEKEFESNDRFMTKINKQKMKLSEDQIRPNNYYLQCKEVIYRTFAKFYDQVKEIREQLQHRLDGGQAQLRKFMQEKILSIEKQLFISTIVMIVQQYGQQKRDNENNLFKPTNCFVIYQQSYPPKSFPIIDLIKIIGKQNYQTKKLHTLKIYEASISCENFSNPTFITCHDCMRVVTNMGFPQHNLTCLKVINGEKQKNIKSHFLLTPQRFLDKFINHQFFNFYDDEKEFQHAYVQYHLKTGINGLSCGRNWCGPCRIKYKRGMSMTHCDFCDFICQCTRCKRYEKIVQLLGHYMKIGGNIDDFKDKFVFNQVFESHLDEFASNNKLKEQIFKKHLKLMYESQVKMNDNLTSSAIWLQLKKSLLLSGVFPEQIPLEFPLQVFFHKDQLRRKNKDQMSRNYEIERKNYNKYVHEKKEKNIELTISKLDDEIKERMIEAQTEQLMILKRKLQKSKVLKTTNPLTNRRVTVDKSDVIIISQSSLKKNQRKFHKIVKTIEVNPLNRLESERQFLKLKKQEKLRKSHSQKDMTLYKDEEYEQSGRHIIDENKSEIEKDKNGLNYGSIWE